MNSPNTCRRVFNGGAAALEAAVAVHQASLVVPSIVSALLLQLVASSSSSSRQQQQQQRQEKQQYHQQDYQQKPQQEYQEYQQPQPLLLASPGGLFVIPEDESVDTPDIRPVLIKAKSSRKLTTAKAIATANRRKKRLVRTESSASTMTVSMSLTNNGDCCIPSLERCRCNVDDENDMFSCRQASLHEYAYWLVAAVFAISWILSNIDIFEGV